eukprot:gene815-885_t
MSGPRVIHNVIFDFKDETSQADINAIFQALIEIKENNLVPGILSFSYGPYESSEGLNQTYNYGFSMVFESIAARDGYIPHPEHDRVKGLIIPHLRDGLKSIVAFDYVLKGTNEF